MYYNEMEEKTNRIEEEKKGLQVHAVITLLVCMLLLAINLIFVPNFMWFIFPWTGMGLGLAYHYFMGVRRMESN